MLSQLSAESDLPLRTCSHCKCTHPLIIQYFNRRLDGFQGLCRMCDRAATKKARLERIKREGPLTKQRIFDYQHSLKGRYSQYKTGAKLRAHLWNITLEEFATFWQQPCTYCGGSISTIGLDRVNSQDGYTMQNVVSCCVRCNRAKHAMSLEDFKSFVSDLYRHLIAT